MAQNFERFSYLLKTTESAESFKYSIGFDFRGFDAMRNKKEDTGLTVNAIAGTYVVTLGLDLDEEKREGCLGFAIQREDHAEDEK